MEPAEVRGTTVGPSDLPNAKGAASIAPEMGILENRAFWVILAVSPQTSHFGRFGQPSPNQGRSPEKKFQLRSCLNQRDRAIFFFTHNCLQTRLSNSYTWGVINPPTPCLWKAPASAQKTQKEIRPAIRRGARWRAKGGQTHLGVTARGLRGQDGSRVRAGRTPLLK